MSARLLADVILVAHLLFILIVVLGGLLVLRWPRLAWLHVPCSVWGALIEFTGWICPLTPLENRLRLEAGQAGYSGGFIDHYIVPLVYPPGLTPQMQVVLGVAVLVINGGVYALLVRRWRRRRVTAGGR
jgi:hypothetical protein